MADRGIADESLQFCAFERTRQDFALREAAQGRRVADGSAKFNTDLECLQIGGIGGGVCGNVQTVPRVGYGETVATPPILLHPPPPPTPPLPPPPHPAPF